MDWYLNLQQHIRQRIDVRQLQLEQFDNEYLRDLIEKILDADDVRAFLPYHEASLAHSGATSAADAEHGLQINDHGLCSNDVRAQLVQRLLDDLVGLGALEPLLRDDSVAEIMVNNAKQIYVERGGVLSLSDVQFADEESVRQVIERMVSGVGRRIDASSPMVDARLSTGARVNAIIPPLALHGSCITIRKFSRRISRADDLVRNGTCSEQIIKFLELAVQQRRNIIICGGTGTGKTTLLNILANWIDAGERVITIEDSAELSLGHDHLVALEARPANQEGEGEISIRQLVINALRMRPDRIVVGECRGGESLDMLQAMNTGHAGSMTTLHANSPRDGLRRLEVMVLMAGMELPLPAIRQQISGAIDLLVQLTRLPGGKRIISRITEVQGLEGDTLALADIFTLDSQSDVRTQDVAAQPTGDVPVFIQRLPSATRASALAMLGVASCYD